MTKKEEITGKFNSFFEVPVAAKIIRVGDIIIATDIKIQKIRSNKVKDGIALNEQEVIGLQARKFIIAESVFKLNELSKPHVIKANDPVNIIYASNNLMLKTAGIALGSGAIGETIKVKNEDTGNVLLGEIVNKNTVQVSGK